MVKDMQDELMQSSDGGDDDGLTPSPPPLVPLPQRPMTGTSLPPW